MSEAGVLSDAARLIEQVAGVLSRALPDSVRELDTQIGERLARIPSTLNEYGVDRFIS